MNDAPLNEPDSTRETSERFKRIEAARDELIGLFSGLIIIGTWELENGETATVSAANGNWHAINGVMRYALHKRMYSAALEATDQHQRSDNDE